jgi:DNA mismatch repair protein MutS2
MDAHSFRVLEFAAVLEHLANETASVLGRGRALELGPAIDPDRILRRLAETREARVLLARGPVPGVEQATDIREALARAGIAGSRLAPVELSAIAATLEAGEHLRRYIRASEIEVPRLAAVAAGLRPPPALWREIRRAVLPDGSVADGASADLSRLRATARSARETAREHLQGILASPHFQAVIAEPVITLRNDRYVIPVLPSYRTHLAGIVQDQSGSGHTVFLEPLSVVEQNNTVRRLDREVDIEIDRILGDLTDRVRDARDDISGTVEALADLDLILAKARLADRWGAAEPRIDPQGTLYLRMAAHPLLLESRRRPAGDVPRDDVVPFDIPLTSAARVLVITGPNAGGKTVALKTVGLLVLMAQAGLHIPASPDSTLPVFEGVYADIGDEQSISQDLSTFSAHMARLRTVLAAADRSSLVLLDEIGAGTDPGEGAALGSAILEALASRDAHVVATTHLDGIKAFVAQNSRMQNAAVEFDLDRMRPLYKLHIGFPGRSFAIDVASRLGIPPSIVQRAREFVGDTAAGISALLDRLYALETKRAADVEGAAEERAKAAQAREEAEALVRGAREQVAAIRARSASLVAGISADARRRVEAVVADLKRGQSVQESRQAIAQLGELTDAALAALPASVPAEEAEAPAGRFEVGQQVRIRHLGQVGTVISDVTAQGLVEVQLPVGKARVSVAALAPAGPAAPRVEAPISWNAGAGDSLSAEINVIGCTVEEASQRVGRYLEDAMLGGLTRVRIIHGKGTGRLRSGIASLLREHPLVLGFQLASFEEGGAGATVVDLGARGAGGPRPIEAPVTDPGVA